jgi:hypothetical protein
MAQQWVLNNYITMDVAWVSTFEHAGTGMDFLFKNNTNGTGIELFKNFYIGLVLILASGQG